MKDGLDIKFEEFLKTIDCSFEDYIDAVRTSIKGPKIFLRRNLLEIRINPYMKSLVSAWKANHDIQFVLDPYACAVYMSPNSILNTLPRIKFLAIILIKTMKKTICA